MLTWLKHWWAQRHAPVYQRHADGRRAEKLAERYLRRQGLKLEARNFLCKNGELDLVMRDGEYLVFVEVRYRAQGGALESIQPRKQAHVIRAAVWYLQAQGKTERQARRFDIVSIQGDLTAPQIDWIKDAFRG